jgi:DNA-binding CsgD family transcriptional regulator
VIDVAGIEHEVRERLRWGARLGALCAATSPSESSADTFLAGVIELTRASGGMLGLRAAEGGCRGLERGLDPACLAAACEGGHEPPLLSAGPARGAVHVFEGAAAALQVPGCDGSVLRVGWADGELRATLLLCFADAEGGWVGELAALLTDLEDLLMEALARLALPPGREADGPLEVAALGAWSRCNVPLIFLESDGAVAAANPAAWRKLELGGDTTALPGWLADLVALRLEALRRDGGLPDSVSGDYAWVSAGEGDPLVRVGLAPVNSLTGRQDSAWLLSVESGGPSTMERVDAASAEFGLTPREGEVLGALADGLSNRMIAEALGISEATVKFHLMAAMRKAGTSSRTELLAALYALA